MIAPASVSLQCRDRRAATRRRRNGALPCLPGTGRKMGFDATRSCMLPPASVIERRKTQRPTAGSESRPYVDQKRLQQSSNAYFPSFQSPSDNLEIRFSLRPCRRQKGSQTSQNSTSLTRNSNEVSELRLFRA